MEDQALSGGWTFFSQTPESKLWFLTLRLDVFGRVMLLVVPPSQAGPDRPWPSWAAPGCHGPPRAGRFSFALDPGRAGPRGAKARPGGAERGQARRGWAALGRPGPAGAKRGWGLAGRDRAGPGRAGLGRSGSPAWATALIDMLHAPPLHDNYMTTT